ncbi:MAG: exopolyphosphatase, partial [Planctomycetaceae bacterium]
MKTKRKPSKGRRPKLAGRPAAVIDVGTTSIRMAVAELFDDGSVRILDTLTQAVTLGKDTFTTNSIAKGTIEDCVRVLKRYQHKLREYGVPPDRLRVVATSAVREAVNRLAFLDRVYSATGIEIQPIDEAEVSRITYLGLQPLVQAEPALAGARTIITEVGGGSMELLMLEAGNVIYSHSHRLGSLRLRETLDAYEAPRHKIRGMMENQIERTVEQVVEHVPADGRIEMVALGGDVRFAASQLSPDWAAEPLGRLDLAALERFTTRMLGKSEDELVRTYHLSFSDAETLGPALLAYVQFARAFKLEHLYVSNFNLRDGLLGEMARGGKWSEEFHAQIIRSAIDLGRKFDFDEAHGRHVAALCRKLFHDLQEEHQLDARFELVLYLAALLHEIGHFISYVSHHKHSMYLIQNSELFGLGKKDTLLVA